MRALASLLGLSAIAVSLALPATAQSGAGAGLDSYIGSVRRQVAKQWLPPASAEYKQPGAAPSKTEIDLSKLDPALLAIYERFANVTVTISPDGTVSACKLSGSCGDEKFDAEALKAVRKIAKFNPLPKNAPNTVTLELGFEQAPLPVAGGRVELR